MHTVLIKSSLYFINAYLKRRKQGTKINSSYSVFGEILFSVPQDSILGLLLCEILFSVPQGSILGSPLFNIYICDFFFESSDIDIANYADDNRGSEFNTPYACSSDIDSVIFKLQKSTERIFRWFRNNNLI